MSLSSSSKLWSKYYKVRYGTRIPDARTEAEMNFITKYVPKEKDIKILDFICGYGRHALSLGELGYKVSGFDIDPESINYANETSKELGLNNVEFEVRDSRDFDIKGHYDLTICMYTSIGFMEPEENQVVFKNLFDSVKSKGIVILDLMNREWAIENLSAYKEKMIEYESVLYQIKHTREILYEPCRERNKIIFNNMQTKESETVEYDLQLYGFNELLEIIGKNNHRLIATYGGYANEPMNEKSQRLVVVTEKL